MRRLKTDPARGAYRRPGLSPACRGWLVVFALVILTAVLACWQLGCTFQRGSSLIGFHVHNEVRATDAGDAILDSIVEDLADGTVETEDVLGGRRDDSSWPD